MSKSYLNPESLFPSLQYGFSQIVTSTGSKTVYLSGQVAWDENQKIVGPNDFEAQIWQTFRNVETAMKEAGGALADVVSLRIYYVKAYQDETHHISNALKAFFSETKAPASTWLGIESLANQDFMIEIEAIGVID